MLLISQRRGQVGGKESLLYFGGWQPWGGGGPTAVQMLIPSAHPPPENQGARAFTERGRGLHAETAQSALTVTLRLVSSGLTSVILLVSGTVNLQLQGWFISVSLRPILGIVAA